MADDATTKGIIDEVERALAANPPRASETVPVWADGPNAEAFEDENALVTPELPDNLLHDFEPFGNEGLGDWLAAARDSAEAAKQADSRGRLALYRALSLAWDFALAAKANPSDYAALLTESRISAQLRAPMTPVVKLVFGATYDKTRLAEYALALCHAERLGLGQGALLGLLENQAGGLKGIVIAERAERRPASKPVVSNEAVEARARAIQPRGIVEMPGDDEFMILVARRIDAGHVAVLGSAGSDDAAIRKALKALTK